MNGFHMPERAEEEPVKHTVYYKEAIGLLVLFVGVLLIVALAR
jgi:hypothetical protein